MRDAREAVVDKKNFKKVWFRIWQISKLWYIKPHAAFERLAQGWRWLIKKVWKKVENKIWQIFKLWYIKSHALIDERDDKLNRWLMR